MKKYSAELPTAADDRKHSRRVEEITERAKSGDDSQRKRFEEAARELGCDDDEATFEKRLRDVAISPPTYDKIKPKRKKNPAR
jgi:hypothetical protein